MSVFVDTSALYALLDVDDAMHRRAAVALPGLRSEVLFTSNYVVVEAAALVDRRLGRRVARDLIDDLLSPVERLWVDEALHRTARSLFVGGTSGGPSLVDHTSFELMRARGIDVAFAYDCDFARHGFELVG